MSQKMSGIQNKAKRSLRESREARRRQEEPGEAKWSQEGQEEVGRRQEEPHLIRQITSYG